MLAPVLQEAYGTELVLQVGVSPPDRRPGVEISEVGRAGASPCRRPSFTHACLTERVAAVLVDARP